MHQDLYEKYEYLMNRLDELPEEIAKAQAIENEYVQNCGGWSALGKNDSERKIVVERATNGALDALTNEFSGVRYAANLHASWLQFLAANGPTFQPTDYLFEMNGTATADDAEALGLTKAKREEEERTRTRLNELGL